MFALSNRIVLLVSLMAFGSCGHAAARQSFAWSPTSGPPGASVGDVQIRPGTEEIWLNTARSAYRRSIDEYYWSRLRAQNGGRLADPTSSHMLGPSFAFSGDRVYASRGYRSDDAGITWTRMNVPDGLPVVRGVSVAPDDPNLLLLVTDEYLLQSTDGGDSFEQVYWGYRGRVVGIGAGVFVATRADDDFQSYRRSSDGGLTWSPTPFPSGFRVTSTPILAEGRLRTVGYRTTGGAAQFALFESGDLGATWTSVLTGSCGLRPSTLLSVEQDGSLLVLDTGLHRISPEGRCSTLLDESTRTYLAGYRSSVSSLSAAVSEEGVIAVAVRSRLYLSRDGGSTWTADAMEGAVEDHVSRLFVDPESGALWAGTEAHGLLESRDGGGSWWPVGFDREHITGIAAGPTAGERWIATRWSGLHRSTDGGQTWDLVPNRSLDSRIEHGFMSNVYADPDGPGVIGIWNVYNAFRSSDGGTSWQSMNAPVGWTIDPPIWASHMTDHGELLLSMFFPGRDNSPSRWEIMRTSDGGVTWEALGGGSQTQPEPLSYAADMLFEDSRRRIWANPFNRGLWYRERHDPAWHLVLETPGYGIDQMIETPDGSLWIGRPGGVARSTDGGLTWNDASDGLPGFATTFAWDPARNVLWAGVPSAGVVGLSMPTAIRREPRPPTPEDIVGVESYPNPFFDRITFRAVVGRPGRVTLEVVDLLGRLVEVQEVEAATAGPITFDWSPGSRAPGMYLVRVVGAGHAWTGRVVRLQ